jgi:endoglycosylceramidase
MPRSRRSRARLAGLLAMALLVPVFTTTSGSSATNAIPRLTQSGRWLVDRSGRVVIVHGFNVVSKKTPYEPAATGFGEDDAAFLQAHGFNAIRLGVILKELEPRPAVFNDAYLASIASTVHLLARHGIYSLLDFHQDLYNERFQGEGFPDWMVQDDGLPAQPQAGFPGNYFAMPALWRAYDHLFANDPASDGVGLRDHFARAWAHVASVFRGDPAVLGYDLFNEPFPGTVYLTCFPPLGCPVTDTTALKPFMDEVVRAVHRVDPGHIAFVEPFVTFDYSAPTYLGKVGDGQVGFSFHPYCLAALNLPVPDSGPVRTFCDVLDEGRVFSNAESQQQASGEVPLVSEFGATSDAAELNSITRMSDAHRMGWLDWAYSSLDDPTGAGSAESLVYDVRKPPAGSNLNAGNLRVLDYPYPMTVAGTPQSFGYDPSSRVFTLRFTTISPLGIALPGGFTLIHVPALQYPSGYHLTVTGARVISRVNDTVVLRTAPGAGTVSVTVAP